MGLFAKYWIKIVAPIVAATVVTAIGFSLLSIGASSFGGGTGNPEFGSVNNWILGGVTLLSCILFNIFAKGFWKQLSVLFGLVVGYILAVCMGMVDFSALASSGLGRDVTTKETAGSIACDGFISALSSVFGCMPITSFSQNVGLVAIVLNLVLPKKME